MYRTSPASALAPTLRSEMKREKLLRRAEHGGEHPLQNPRHFSKIRSWRNACRARWRPAAHQLAYWRGAAAFSQARCRRMLEIVVCTHVTARERRSTSMASSTIEAGMKRPGKKRVALPPTAMSCRRNQANRTNIESSSSYMLSSNQSALVISMAARRKRQA